MADTISEAEAANRLMRLAKEIARHDKLYHDQRRARDQRRGL